MHHSEEHCQWGERVCVVGMLRKPVLSFQLYYELKRHLE
jgi:hypothetical protein